MWGKNDMNEEENMRMRKICRLIEGDKIEEKVKMKREEWMKKSFKDIEKNEKELRNGNKVENMRVKGN